MKGLKNTIIMILMVVTVFGNVVKDTIKDRLFIKSIFVKVVKITFTTLAIKLFRLSLMYFTVYQTYAVAMAFYSFGIPALILLLGIGSANSLDRRKNEDTYNIISLIWMFPISILFAIFESFLPSFIIAVMVSVIKIGIDKFLKAKLIKWNERYVHGFAWPLNRYNH